MHVLVADGINEQFDATLFDHNIILPRSRIETKAILEAGTAPTDHRDPQPALLHAFLEHGFFHFFYGQIRQRQDRPVNCGDHLLRGIVGLELCLLIQIVQTSLLKGDR